MKSKGSRLTLPLALRFLVGVLIGGSTLTQLFLAPLADRAELALAQEPTSPLCAGDEAITFAPSAPAVGEELLISVTSSRQHTGVWLYTPDRARPYRTYEGGRGWVWDWRLTPSKTGEREVAFFVESTTLCASTTLVVGPPSLASTPTPGPAGSWSELSSNGNESDNSNDNDDDNGNDNEDREATPTRTPTGTRTATPTGTRIPAPSIREIAPASVCRGEILTITGRRFGESRGLVDGEVLIAGAQVRDYLRWSASEIVVVVPDGAAEEQDQEVFVVTAGGFDRGSVSVFSAC
jgi:hypothetical protein